MAEYFVQIPGANLQNYYQILYKIFWNHEMSNCYGQKAKGLWLLKMEIVLVLSKVPKHLH